MARILTLVLLSLFRQSMQQLDITAPTAMTGLPGFWSLNLGFDEMGSKYKQQMVDSGLKFSSTERPTPLADIRDAIKRRLDEAEHAASVLRFSAQLTNSPQFDQQFLTRAYCEGGNISTTSMGGVTTVFDLPNDVSFEYSNRYKANADPSCSGVTVPVEVYYCSDEVKKDIYWTKSLDVAFKANAATFPRLSHQYVATDEGVIRLYPATAFSMPVTYDSRLRTFYTQSATMPKLVVIAMDSSGSVNGQVTQFMENSLDDILSALNDNDLLAMFFFKNDWVNLLPSDDELEQRCASKERHWFVRATFGNKQAMKNAVFLHDNFNGTANFDIAFQHASQIFDNVDVELYCSKVMILITDGGKGAATEAGESLHHLVERHPDVSLMVFLQGQDVYDGTNADMPVLACSAGGHFYRVGLEESVRYSVTQYINFQSHEVILNNVTYPTWSNVHMQPWTGNQGPVITVTFPVYNSTNPELNSLLGVSAVDVPVMQFLEATNAAFPRRYGEYILVNNKGTVVFSENLAQTTYYFDENFEFPEMHQNDFFREISSAEDEVSLEEAVVNAESGESRAIEASLENLPGIQYVSPVTEVRYSWEPLTPLPFTLLHRQPVLPGSGDRVLRPLGADRVATVTDTSAGPSIAEKARWAFYHEFNNTIIPHYSEVESGQRVGLRFESSVYCPGIDPGKEGIEVLFTRVFNSPDYPLIEGCMENEGYWDLIFDLYFIYQQLSVVGSTSGSSIVNSIADIYSDAKFVKFGSGVLLTYGYAADSDIGERFGLFSTYLTLESDQASIIGATLAMPHVPYQFRVGVNYAYEIDTEALCFQETESHWVYDKNTYMFPFIITRPLSVSLDDGTEVPFGVAGYFVDHKFFNNWIWGSSSGCDSSSVKCYVVDEGGFLVSDRGASLSPDQLQIDFKIGAHLSVIDWCLMEQLVRDGFYERVTVRQNKCRCAYSDTVQKLSLSPELTHLLRRILLTGASVVHSIYSLFASLLSAQSWMSNLMGLFVLPEESQQLETGVRTSQLCQRQITKYYFGTETQKSARQASCAGSCLCRISRYYYAERIPLTNLLLVSVADRACTGCEHLHTDRIRLIENPIQFQDTLGKSMNDDGSPVSEYKVNTCQLKDRKAKKNWQCKSTYREADALYKQCDTCAQFRSTLAVFAVSSLFKTLVSG